MEGLTKSGVRSIVAEFVKNHPNFRKCDIVSHFLKMGVAKRTTYNIIRNLETRGDVTHASTGKSCRPVVKMLRQKRRALVLAARHRVGVSTRLLARRFGISQSYVRKILAEEGLKYRTRTKAPSTTPEQRKSQKIRIRRLASEVLNTDADLEVVMDDESYFTYQGSEMPANKGYYAGPGGDAPEDVKHRPIGKFPRKLLVWVAISPRGISRPVITPSRANVNGAVYREKCIKGELLPFLAQHYPHGGYVFWPDLAASHYARETLELLDRSHVRYVPREKNPPNVPQLRPIEDFWGLMKQRVYKGGWSAKSDEGLKRRIRQALQEIDLEVVHGMMRAVPKRVRAAKRNGVTTALH